MSENRVIGAGGKIPWHLPEDFKWFRKTTWGKTVLMGRKTFESLGKPLANRLNIVLTRNPRLLAEDPANVEIYRDAKVGSAAEKLLRQKAGEQPTLPGINETGLVLWGDLQSLTKDRGAEIWVIGGANVYEQTLPFCSDLFLTRVKRIVPGDAFFPSFEDAFVLVGTVLENEEFAVEHYQHRVRLIA